MEKIQVNGIDCYGPLRWDSNVIVIGTVANGEGFEEVWADGCPSFSDDGSDDDRIGGAKDWAAVIAILLPWAERIGLEIQELSAC